MNAITYISKCNNERCINASIDDTLNASVMRNLVVFNLFCKRDNFLFD